MNGKRKALGRGLGALIPGAPPPPPPPSTTATGSDAPRTVAIEDIHPSPLQPRQSFDEGKLDEMAQTMRGLGVIQPLVLRPRPGGGYEIIAGERRWRAAQRAGLHDVPAVVVRDASPSKIFEMQMVENLQREDLNPIDEAEGYHRLVQEFGYTQEMLASRVGKDRSTVANVVRLLKLPPSVRELVTSGRLGMGHARALLGLETADAMERLARKTASQQLSVRQVEGLVAKDRRGGNGVGKAAPPGASPAARDLVLRLQQGLGARVKLVEAGPGRGHLEIHYTSLDELDGILKRILR